MGVRLSSIRWGELGFALLVEDDMNLRVSLRNAGGGRYHVYKEFYKADDLESALYTEMDLSTFDKAAAVDRLIDIRDIAVDEGYTLRFQNLGNLLALSKTAQKQRALSVWDLAGDMPGWMDQVCSA